MDEWWRGAVIYQIYPRSFRDSNGDGVGDLAGIRERLDYVASLNVDAIWLSPVFVSPMRDFGYDVADYCNIDPLFGSLDDFDWLLADAHARGLRIILDQVYSHSSDQHPWFEQSRQDRTNPKSDWYVWADPKPDGTPPNNWLSVFGGVAWAWEPRRRQYYFHNFLREQPDLNLHNPAVQDAVLAAAEFWLARGVDGFRVDVANFFCHDRELRDNPPSGHPAADKAHWMQRPLYTRNRPETLAFVARFRALLDRYPGTMAVAEIAAEDQLGTMIAYTEGARRYHTAYSFVFMRENLSAALVRQAVENWVRRSTNAWPSWAFSNHDVVRVVSRWGQGAERAAFAKAMVTLLVSLPGTIFLYQGEELGLPQAEVPFERLQDPEGKAFWPRDRGRDGARTPIPWQAEAPYAGFSAVEPWLPLDAMHVPLAVAQQELDDRSVLAYARALLAWRRRHPALLQGDIRFAETPEPVVAFTRRWGSEELAFAFNLSHASVELAAPWPRQVTRINTLACCGHLDNGRLELPPWAGFVGGV